MKKQNKKLSDIERIKTESDYLRGTIAEGLRDPLTGALSPDDNKLLKFHGSYQQDDRDVRDERRRKKLEPAYQFMIRVRMPAGLITPEQWLEMDRLARTYANGTLKITTRQTFQFHGILKWNLKQTIKEINDALLTTIAACGDVNRNVMTSPNPDLSDLHREVFEVAKQINDHLLPRTPAYHEIWLDGKKQIDTKEGREIEPIYGKTYLPRKFKIGVAVPPSNDVDIFSQDLGFIAIVEEGKLTGFNVVVGGGMGMTHGERKTYPQIGRVIGFCTKEQVVDVAEKVVLVQRDYGNRSDRKYARLKYTIDSRGIGWFKNELESRLGWKLQKEKPFHFTHNGDRYGWIKGNGKWHLTLFIPGGRLKDGDEVQFLTGLREIAKIHTGEFRLTPNQNVIIANVTEEKKKEIERLVETYNLESGKFASPLWRNSISCVGLPTCGLAMAESERYLPSLLEKIEAVADRAGLKNRDIVIRMSGCPNSCSRAPLAEIGFIGKAPGKYNLYLGGGYAGQRLNKLYRENIGEKEILETLEEIFRHYAKEGREGERFGDFVIRAGYVKEVKSGLDFHDEPVKKETRV